MKNLILTSMLVLAIAVSLSAQEIPFVFDKNKIDVGTMYVYDYSENSQGFNPSSKEYVYVKTLNNIEIMWIPIKDTLATYIEKYKMNWHYMMFENMNFKSLKNKNNISIGATFKGYSSIDFSKKIMKYAGTYKGKDGSKEHNSIRKLESIPTYFYYLTELMPLWFALRFYPLDKREIYVNHNANGYNSKFDIKYLGKEDVEVPYGKVLCHKFELFPQMSFAMKFLFKPKKAWIWLMSEDESRYMVKYRNNNRLGQGGNVPHSVEYRLVERNKMTTEEWEKFKKKCGVKSEKE